MEMCYDGVLAMPSSYALMDEEEMSYVEGGMSLKEALQWVGVAVLGGIVYDVLKIAAIKVGAWAALNAAAVITVVSRGAAIALLAGIVACYGYAIYKTYNSLMKRR